MRLAIRHPNYTLEGVMFLFIYMKALTTGLNWFGVLFFFVLYWIRSEREDAFMAASNPEYAEYRQKVPWKYLPGVI